MLKSITLLLDEDDLAFTNYCHTYRAINEAERLPNEVNVITTIPQFLSFEYCDALYVRVNNKTHKITLGECEGTKKIIKPEHNLQKMLFAGEFDWF